MVQKLMPGPASHLFLTSFSKATRRSIVAKAEEVGEQVRGKAMFLYETMVLQKFLRIVFEKVKARPPPGEEGGDAASGEDKLAFTAGGNN